MMPGVPAPAPAPAPALTKPALTFKPLDAEGLHLLGAAAQSKTAAAQSEAVAARPPSPTPAPPRPLKRAREEGVPNSLPDSIAVDLSRSASRESVPVAEPEPIVASPPSD
jgi:hypothetical protein